MQDDIMGRKFPYRQMILTLWQEDGHQQSGSSRWRLSLQNPHTSERMGFQRVEEMAAFLLAWMEEQGKPVSENQNRSPGVTIT